MSRPFGLTIVVPVYNGAGSIRTLVDALATLVVERGLEIVLVNDGSSDDSLTVCRALAQRCPVPLTVVDLARNFGEHNAVMAGLAQARGDCIITMDDDLQNPPEEVVRLYDHARLSDLDVVYARFAERRHSLWRNLGSRFANWCADRLIDKPKGLYLSSFRCISAFAATEILAYRGPYPYIDGLLMQVTQRIGCIEAVHLPRASGRSGYTLRRLTRLWLSMVLNFSAAPLRIGALLGFVFGGLGLLILILIGAEGGSFAEALGGTPLSALLLMVAGAQLCVLGVIGEYLGRLVLTINGKPQFVVRSLIRGAKPAAPEENR